MVPNLTSVHPKVLHVAVLVPFNRKLTPIEQLLETECDVWQGREGHTVRSISPKRPPSSLPEHLGLVDGVEQHYTLLGNTAAGYEFETFLRCVQAYSDWPDELFAVSEDAYARNGQELNRSFLGFRTLQYYAIYMRSDLVAQWRGMYYARILPANKLAPRETLNIKPTLA